MQRIGTNIRRYLQRLQTPEFITGAAFGILAALVLKAVGEAVQNTLNHQIVGLYLMVIIAFLCVVLVGFSLMRIEKLVENRNYTRFITSKSERLNLMTECIKNAKRSIYIISDLSGAEEIKMKEHAKYIGALNQVIDDKKGNPNFEVKRIIVPSYASGMDTETNPDWIYKIPVTEAYREHFRRLREFDQVSPKHNNGPRNVLVILIDNKYLFWKPELSYGDATLDTLLDGGLYLEDYTREGIADFAEWFRIMFDRSQFTDLSQLVRKKTSQSNEHS